MVTRTTATVDDVLRLADAGQRYELVNGELVEMSPTNFEHGAIERRIGRRLGDFADANNLGEVVVGEVLFQLDPDGQLARAADVAFVRLERLPGRRSASGVFIGAPDLVVEIISPGNSANEIQQKIHEWLDHGAQIVLAVYPDQRSIVLWRENGAVILREDDEMSLDPTIPGFRCKVAELFPSSSKEVR